MNAQIGSIYANLSLESASFVNGLERSVKATESASSAIERGLGRATTAIKTFAAAYVADKAIDGARRYLELADASKTMGARLSLATAQFGNLAQAQADSERIATVTRSGIQETTSLYGKFLEATRTLGKDQSDGARATETFSKALKIGGADAASAASATLQFGQALASGVLRGDEFNSVNEASPRIMRLLADSLGVPVGALRKMAEAGKLTSGVLFKALTDPKFTDGIDKEFQQLPKTFDQAMTLIENAMTKLVGDFDNGGQFSTAIANFFTEGTDGMTGLTGKAEEVGIDIRAAFEGLHDAFAPLVSGADDAFGNIRTKLFSLRNDMAAVLGFVDDVQNKGKAVSDFLHGGNAQFRAATGFKSNIPTSTLKQDFLKGFDTYQKTRTGEILDQKTQARFGFKNGKIDLSKGLFAQGKGTGVPISKPAASGGGKKGGKGKDPAKEAQRLADKQRRDDEAFTASLDRSNLDLLDSRSALATTADERFAFERQQLEAEKKQRLDQIGKDGPQGSKRYDQGQVDQLRSIEEQIAANKLQAITAKQTALAQEQALALKQGDIANATEIADLQSGIAKTAKDRRAAELRLLDLQEQQERVALEGIIASRDSTVAEKEIAKRRLDLLPQIKALQTQQVEQQTQGPLASYLDSIPRTGAEINETLQGIEVDGLSALQEGLVDAVRGVGSLGDAFSNMADEVISGLAKIAIQQMVIQPLGSLLFGGGGGGGGSGIMSSLLGGIKGLFGGGLTGKANGGIGNRGTYLVGEHGPETLTMGGPFSVTPNHKLDDVRGVGASKSISFAIDARGATDPAAVKLLSYQAISEAMPMILNNAYQHTYSKLGRPRM